MPQANSLIPPFPIWTSKGRPYGFHFRHYLNVNTHSMDTVIHSTNVRICSKSSGPLLQILLDHGWVLHNSEILTLSWPLTLNMTFQGQKVNWKCKDNNECVYHLYNNIRGSKRHFCGVDLWPWTWPCKVTEPKYWPLLWSINIVNPLRMTPSPMHYDITGSTAQCI